MTQKSIFHLTYLLFSIFIITSCSKHEQSLGKIPNPSFEKAEDEKPDSWRTYTWSGEADFGYENMGKTGTRSVAITSTEGADVSWATIISVKPFCLEIPTLIQ